MDKKWPLRWDLLLRYRLIEIIALWEGRLTTNNLCNSFGIGRQQASKDINEYIRKVGPGNLVYDRQLKGYKPTAEFEPQVTEGLADEYLHLLNRNKDINKSFAGLDLGSAKSEVLHVPIRDVRPEVVRPVVQAAQQGKRLEVDYISLSSEAQETRVIAPHTLVYSGYRWHVRAYCEKRKDYTDFVLSRFRGEPDMIDHESPNPLAEDISWNTLVEIIITPDSRLSPAQQTIIANDYGMTRKRLSINSRAALVPYALKQLQVDPYTVQQKPEAQQIVVANLDELRQWLF
jgi:predicted DNA-binding transcriptional regulator YafY